MTNAFAADEYKTELLNENNGFVTSIIFSIVQDEDGFLWFGTAYDGVLRYDGKRVVRYQHDPNNKNSLAHNNAGNLTLDNSNNLWIGSWGGGLSKLDKQSHTFSHYQTDSNNKNSISDMRVKKIFKDNKGDIWLGTAAGGLNKYNQNKREFTRFSYETKLGQENPLATSHYRIWDINQTAEDTLWIGVHNGLNRFNTTTNTFQSFVPHLTLFKPEHQKIRQILKGKENTLFLATDDGVLLFETQSNTFTALDIADFSNVGPVYSIIKTNFDHYWVTTNYGVFSFSDDDLTLKKVKLGINDQCSQTLFQDQQGTIWLSCEGVGVYKIIKQEGFKRFEHPLVKSAYSLLATDNDSLLIGTAKNGIQHWSPSSNTIKPILNETSLPEVWGMTETSQGDLWFFNSNSVYKLENGEQTREFHVPEEFKEKKLFKQFKHITADAQDNIWICSESGLFVIRDGVGQLEMIPIESSIYSVSTGLYQDSENRIWIGSLDALVVWDDKTKETKHFNMPKIQDASYVSNNYFYAILQDKQQRMWVSTPQGLYLFDEKAAEFNMYSNVFVEAKNLGVRFIKEDSLGYLWLFTARGVSQLNPDNGQIEHFNKTDGLSGTRYFIFDVAQKSNGKIFFSSRDGVHYFDPLAIEPQQFKTKTLLTHFEVLGTPNTQQKSYLGSTNIDLAYNQNYLKFEFATLDLSNAQQIQYDYKLEGFDQDWIKNGTNNTAVYTNLSGGEYLFKVRSAFKKGLYYEDDLQVKVNIATPYWQQWWMYIFYVGLIFLGIAGYIYRQKQSLLNLEKQVAEKTASIQLKSSKLEVANKVKSQFLANMSHEIRTPLTTVIGQAEAIICRDIDSADIYKEVEVIHDSGLYLLSLLNDILDLTKIEQNKFSLELHSQDLHDLLENIDRMFSIQAKRKGLPFTLSKQLPTPFIVNIDNLRVKQILINLCSNAIKFTQQGHVTLDVLVENRRLVFKITDTGIGMTNQQVQQAFESFTQADTDISRRFGGTGLGLSLSRGLAELMDGEISVISSLNEGSTFTFSFPVEILSASDNYIKPALQKYSSNDNLFSGKILLAEDHTENRRLIARLLSKLGLTVYTAIDGSDAIKQYLEHEPDVILLDIQMPNVDGIQAYKILRDKGCHLPIIAVTANAMSHEIEQYLSLGFNGHLSKPLDRKNLIATVAKYFTSQSPRSVSKAEKALGDIDMSDLVIQFKANLIEEKQQLKVHVNNQDMQSLAKQTHRLIGASQLFGFDKLSEIALELETCVKNNNKQQLNDVLERLFAEIKILSS